MAVNARGTKTLGGSFVPQARRCSSGVAETLSDPAIPARVRQHKTDIPVGK